MQGQGEERQVQQFCPLSPDKDGVDKLIGSVRRLLVHERIQQRALLREDIANSLCDIAQASLLTPGGSRRRCDDRFCENPPMRMKTRSGGRAHRLS
jgi:hypothetical protein